MKAFKLSIRRSMIFAFILVGSLSILSISVLWITTEFSEHKTRTDQFKESSIKAHKNVLKHEVERVISYINFSRQQNPNLSEQDLKSSLLDYFSTLHFKHGGYVFINTYDGLALLFDGKKVTEHKDITDLTDPNGLRIFDMELEAIKKSQGDYMEYTFHRMDTSLIEQKLSYIKGYDDWEWIVGAGLYLNNTMKEIQLANLTHKQLLYNRILKIVALFAVLFLSFLVFGFLLAKYIAKDFKVFNTFFNSAATTEARIESKDLRVQEFIRLSETANEMIDKRITDRREIISQRNTMQKYLDIVGVIVLALDTKGNITLINNKGCEILGYQESELLNRNWFEMCLPKDNQLKHKEFLTKGLKENSFNQIITKNGHLRTIEWHNMVIYDDNKTPTGILSSGIDVTEKLQWQNDLVDSEKKYRLLFEKTSDPICIFDNSLNFIDGNTALLNLFEASEMNELKGRSLSDFSSTSKEYKNTNIQLKCDEALSRGSSRFEWEHINLNGKKCYSDILLTLINMGGKDRLYAVIRDIKLRTEYEQKLIEAREKAEQSDKLKTTFLNNISHEVRTPLNTIMGFSQLLTQNHISKKEVGFYVSTIMSSGENLTRIIDDIMDYSRYQAGEIMNNVSSVYLKCILVEAFHEINPQIARKPIEFQLSILEKDQSWTIQTDKKRILQVLTHLLNNAMKFTDQGKVEFGFTFDENFIKFFVSDTGIGIKEEHRESIFGKFNQVDHFSSGKIYGGTGLGLSLSKAIVESMGGKIWVENNPTSLGSVFYFTVPLLLAEDNRIEINNLSSRNNKSDIVFITNNILTFTNFSNQVETCGFSIIHLTQSVNAIDYCQQNKSIHLVIVDLEDEQDLSSEKSFFHILSKNTPSLFKIAVIHKGSQITKEAALENGFSDFIFKPFNSEDVQNTISYWLNKKRKHRL